MKDTGSFKRIEMTAPSSRVSRARSMCFLGVDSEGMRALRWSSATLARERSDVDCWYLRLCSVWWSCLIRSRNSFSAMVAGSGGAAVVEMGVIGLGSVEGLVVLLDGGKIRLLGKYSFLSGKFSSKLSNHARTLGKCRQRSASILKYCDPSPGNRKAVLPGSAQTLGTV